MPPYFVRRASLLNQLSLETAQSRFVEESFLGMDMPEILENLEVFVNDPGMMARLSTARESDCVREQSLAPPRLYLPYSF